MDPTGGITLRTSSSQNQLGIEAKSIHLADARQVGFPKQRGDPLNGEEIVSRVAISAAGESNVEDAYPSRPQRALDLLNEPVRVQRMVEHVGELEIEGSVGEGLGMEVATHHQRRGRHQIHPYRVGNPQRAQRRYLLPHSGPHAECARVIRQKASVAEVGEETRENGDFPSPISGGPDAPEAGVQGLVELELEVVVVGAEAGSNLEEGGGRRGDLVGEGYARVRSRSKEERKEGQKGEGEEEEEWLQELFHRCRGGDDANVRQGHDWKMDSIVAP
ncbi:hypothetical protein HPP92_012312 [Vanilla planifolia]|uniref:Uncharacterized protein n=1 Tax=Vanilla planifolia TaxID=51239 RepID=A0A835UXM8_VANPL|nr:hypothetical protein HPP92_012312 [Vanilla planifolia]